MDKVVERMGRECCKSVPCVKEGPDRVLGEEHFRHRDRQVKRPRGWNEFSVPKVRDKVNVATAG